MTETRPVYIPCASGNNAHTDVLIARHGDLVRLLGHPCIDMAPDDAAHLARVMMAMARECGYDDAKGNL